MILFIFKNRLLIIIAALAIVGSGILAFSSMSIDAYPDISGVQVQIVTPFSGRAAEEVEKQISIPIERTMYGIPNVEMIRSRSIFGLSLVQIIFEPGVDDYWAREVTSQKLPEIILPPGATPTLGSLSTAYGEIYRYVLESDSLDAMELRTINDWTVIPRLLKLRGIAEVANFGGLGKQFAVQLDPDKMLSFSVSLSDVTEAIAKNNGNAGGAFIELGSSALIMRGIGAYPNYKLIEKTFVKNSNGSPVLIRDIGSVKIDHVAQSGIFGINHNPNAVEGIIKMRRGENPSLVLERIRNEIKILSLELNHKNIKITPFYDRSELVKETVHTVSHNVVFGIVLVVLTILLFFGHLRISLIVGLTIPFSLLFSFLMMKILNIPISLLSIGAVDFGIIVDGAILMAEGMSHGEKAESGSLIDKVKHGFSKTLRPMLFSMLIIVITYLPLLSLRYIEGLLFKPMAVTLCLSLVGALIFSVFILPLFMSSQWIHTDTREPQWLKRVKVIYSVALNNFLNLNRKVFFVVLSLLFISSILVASKLGTEFLPYMDEGIFWIRANFPEGITLTENARYATELRDLLLSKIPEIKNVSTQTGRSDSGTDPFPMNRMEMMVGLTDRDTWRKDSSKLSLEAEIRDVLSQEFPTTKFNITQPIIDSVTEDANGTSANLALDIVGPDLVTIRVFANSILKIIRSIPGNMNTNIEQEGPQPQLRIEIDQNEISRYQLNVDLVNDTIASAIAGLPAGYIFDGERRFDIVTKYISTYTNSPDSISRLPIYNSIGMPVMLDQLTDVNVKDGETLIARNNGSRKITVRTDIRGRSQGDFVAEAKSKIASSIHLPEGYSLQWLGMFENLERARHHFMLLIPLTISLIAFILFLNFNSLSQVLLVFITLPISLFGAVGFLWARSMAFSVSAGVGFSSLFGVATMYGIILVSKYREQKSKDLNDRRAIINASVGSLTSIVLTAAVAIIGLIPAMYSNGIGSDVQKPIATVIVGGLLSTSVLSIFVIPFLLDLMSKKVTSKV